MRISVMFLAFAMSVVGPAAAQSRPPAAVEISAGSELENYLRLLQISGRGKAYPWTLRGFSARELEQILPADSVEVPWSISPARLRARFSVAPISLNTVFNSSFPYARNDGAVWAGRGATVSVSGGVTARLGGLSLTVAPVTFLATNQTFPLLDNGLAPEYAVNDGLFPEHVDHPQRFGDRPYGRGDAGASEIRFDSRYLAVGFGNAPMWWGPAVEYPFVLGTNAPGFPHAFAGTGAPINVVVGTLHGRVFWGKLSQSAYSPIRGSDRFVDQTQSGRDRLMTGLVLTFAPRVAPHLELGMARFAHLPYLPEGISGAFFRKAWPTLLKKNVSTDSFVEGENELASVFARWAFPTAGLELYVEHGHDDWYNDLRDLVQEPDHNKGYVIGFQKVLGKGGPRMSAVRGEINNYQTPPLGRDRPGQGAIYAHSLLRQGHTNRGQLLGSGAGVGAAAASILAWDSYSPAGRTTFTWRRIVRAHTGTFHLDGISAPYGIDVIHALGAERSRGTARLRYTFGVDIMANLNRNFTSDVFNLNARAGIQWSPTR